jgi:hypothetical protein
MSLTVIIAILAIIATLGAAFLQPIVSHWLTPKQRLRLDVTGSRYLIPATISREMSEHYYQSRGRGETLKAELGDFLRDAQHYQSFFFDVTVTNTGKTISRNIFLECSAYGKYVLIQSRLLHYSAQPEYLLGELQPSEKVRCQIWSTAPFPTYDFGAYEMFSARDDHSSPKQIVLRRFYDRTSHYLLEREVVKTLLSVLKWTLLPSFMFLLTIYLISELIHWLWRNPG